MTEYRDQGEGELVPGRGFAIVSMLGERQHIPTAIEFSDGAVLTATAVAFARDIGEEWEHLYFWSEGRELVTSTSNVVRLIDPASGSCLYQRPSM